VNDAFGTAHRAHASTEGVTRFLPSAAGLLMARELDFLGRALDSPERPFAAVLGGAKVSDKIGVMENLLDKADTLLIGGGMAATFLKGMGMDVGSSPVDADRLEFAAGFVNDAGDRLLLPGDVVVADDFSPTATHRTVDVSRIPSGWQIMDVGPDTVARFQEALGPCRTVLWNGPMGVFEWEAFAQGTAGLARTVAGLSRATSIVGGGSTAEAVGRLGLADRMSHVSTGGGASLEFLEGRVLPGVAALADGGEAPGS
jgi:phosphoglycerate kinase